MIIICQQKLNVNEINVKVKTKLKNYQVRELSRPSFREKILNFQSLLFSQFRYVIQCIFKRFSKFS
jgi:hypothetical protein